MYSSHHQTGSAFLGWVCPSAASETENSYAREERAEESDLVLPPTKRAKEDCGHPKKITATKQVERSACQTTSTNEASSFQAAASSDSANTSAHAGDETNIQRGRSTSPWSTDGARVEVVSRGTRSVSVRQDCMERPTCTGMQRREAQCRWRRHSASGCTENKILEIIPKECGFLAFSAKGKSQSPPGGRAAAWQASLRK